MGKTTPKREDRRFPTHTSASESRSCFDRDHDRVLYSSAFRRLAGVTQVVNPSEGQIFHNRLTHSIKVAQIGRRLAEKILYDYTGRENRKVLVKLGGLTPSVVEAAALAHDLGNPPFGHIGEQELNSLVIDNHVADGFEGNAQSFRIVNKLCFGYKEIPGLNLTRATLNAILKYPWLHKDRGEANKFGAYETEREEFEWARQLRPSLGSIKTIEAALMDLADDITYAIHDLEDFYRANVIPPIGQIYSEISQDRMCRIVEGTKETWFPPDKKMVDAEKNVQAFIDLFSSVPTNTPFHGTQRERRLIHGFSSTMISHFVESAKVNNDLEHFGSPIELTQESGVELIILKYITKYYVIDNPGLIRRQFGETQIIKALFKYFLDASSKDTYWQKIFPMSCQERLKELDKCEYPEPERIRIVADTVSYLSDQEALKLFMKLNGISPGSVFDHLII